MKKLTTTNTTACTTTKSFMVFLCAVVSRFFDVRKRHGLSYRNHDMLKAYHASTIYSQLLTLFNTKYLVVQEFLLTLSLSLSLSLSLTTKYNHFFYMMDN
jgi:hypothetical protein